MHKEKFPLVPRKTQKPLLAQCQGHLFQEASLSPILWPLFSYSRMGVWSELDSQHPTFCARILSWTDVVKTMAATPKPFFKAASHKSSYKHNGHFCASLALLPPCYWSNTIIGGEQFITSDRPGQKELNSAHWWEAGASSVQAKTIYIQEQPEPQTVTYCPTSIYYPSYLACREECENYMSVNRTVHGIEERSVRLLL